MKRYPQRLPNGLTIVEVVCALVLLSVTVTSLLTAQAHSLHQLRKVSQQQQAAQFARDLITKWRIEKVPLTNEDEGWFDESPEWSWRRVVTPRDDTELLEITVLIERRHPDGSRQIIAEYVWLEDGDES